LYQRNLLKIQNMSIYNREWLIEKFQKKEKIKYLLFWGHQPAKDGSVTASCFSQWWNAPFTVEGKRYATAEHWMMAKKAELFGDAEIAKKILSAGSPAEAKKMGRLVVGFDPILWDEHKFRIVCDGNFHKFSQHSELRQFLINTKERVLVEASPVDPIWGIGLAVEDVHSENPLLWKGENLLGFALMEVRDKLNKE
jgi:ribA/ribD-fused uncharacterized protein